MLATITQNANEHHPPQTRRVKQQEKSTAKWSENLYRVTNSRSSPLLSSMLHFSIPFYPLSIPSRQSYRLKFIHSNGTAFWFPPSTLPNDDDSDYFDCCCCYHTKYVTFCVILLYGECILDHDNCFIRIFMNRMRYTFLINTYYLMCIIILEWCGRNSTVRNSIATLQCVFRENLHHFFAYSLRFWRNFLQNAPSMHITSMKFSSNFCDMQHPTCLCFTYFGVYLCVPLLVPQ